MQIHELNSFSGTPGSSDYLVTDNGTDTSKISATDLIAPAVDAVATETTTRQSADNLLQAQIDQFVAPSGTAPNPTEIENARVGADGVTYTTLGEAIRTQVSDLKSALNSISVNRTVAILGTLNANITNNTVDAVSYCRMAYCDISDALHVRITKDAGQRFAVGFSDVVPANGVPLSGVVLNNTGTQISTDVPSGSKYVAILYWNTNVDHGDDSEMLESIVVSAIYGAKDEIARKEIQDTRTELSDEIEEIESRFSEADYEKTYRATPSFTNNYYMGTNGVPAYNTDYVYTQKLSVQPGDVVKIIKTDGSIVPAMRFVCAYNGNTAIPSKGSDSHVYTYTVPDGIDGVVLSTSSKTADAIDVYRQEKTYFAKSKAPNMGFFKETGDLSDGGSLSLPYENAKNNVVVCFTGRVTSFNAITIGKYSPRRYITIDNTHITLNDGVNTYTEAHGLTIANNLSVTILSEDNTDSVKKVVVESLGNIYTFTNSACYFEEGNGNWSVVSDGTAMTDCVLSLTTTTINNKLWMFGDSYFSIAPNRWVYYLLQDDFVSPFINGYSGENAQNAIAGLKNLLTARVPENVLWCLGMNNGDTSSAVNAMWKSVYDELVNLSKEYGFNLILSTIPNTPTVNNNYKNAIVKASGYQYIDFSTAVNVGNDGSWISGALSSDNVHPTEIGAKILYRRAIADCPQLTSLS